MALLFKLIKKVISPKINDNKRQQDDPGQPNNLPIEKKLKENLDRVKNEMGNSNDLIIREFSIHSQIAGACIFIDGLVNEALINDFILESIKESDNQNVKGIDSFELMKEKIISVGGVQVISNWNQLYLALLSGDTILVIDGYTKVIGVGTRGGEKRAIVEPTTQLSIRGPKDSFTESIRTNTALIRRRIKSPNLRIEVMRIGAVTQTDVSIVYLQGIVDKAIIEEVKTRLNRINTDSILESGYIEQFIEDQTFTPFPTLYHTERPDVITSQILEGRVAILIDGTPFVLTAPAVFIEFFQAVEDYYSRFDISASIRILRILAFFISLTAPSIFIAATTFHQEMIPTTMAITIAAQREGVPFPAFIEAMIMEVTFEILREAGLRLPRAVGQAVSIVGALVIGQAAVQAGIVSPVMVIVVSITAIASFSTPTFSMAISARLIRFALMILAATFGFYGVSLGLLFMLIHLCSLRSFGVPYMSPLAPMSLTDQQDVFIRFPFWAMKTRPKFLSKNNQRRTGDNLKPSPKQQKGGQSDANNQHNSREET